MNVLSYSYSNPRASERSTSTISPECEHDRVAVSEKCRKWLSMKSSTLKFASLVTPFLTRVASNRNPFLQLAYLFSLELAQLF